MTLGALLVVLAVAVVFVVVSSSSLPPVVASHFAAGGAANGFMARDTYVLFMVLITSGVPLTIGAAFGLTRFVPASLINLPNRSFWLAPERVHETRQYMGRQGAALAAFVAAYMCLAHWQVVQANQVQPPRLAEQPFLAGLALFVLVTLVWAGFFMAHFRKAGT